MTTRFGFLVHPFFSYDLEKRFPLTKNLPSNLVEWTLKFLPPFKGTERIELITNLGKTEGYFIVCPLTPKQFVELSPRQVVQKLIQAGKYAEKLGVEILGVDTFLSSREEIFNSFNQQLGIPITSGKTYTTALGLSALKKAAGLLGINLNEAEVLIVGATGDFGSALAQILAEQVKYLTIMDRDELKLDRLAQFLLEYTGTAVRISSNLNWVLKRADLVVFADRLEGEVDVSNFKPGTLVCDFSWQPNISKQAAERRKDVLFIQGGSAGLPNAIDYKYNLLEGSYHSSAIETMLIALEGKVEDRFFKQEISISRVRELSKLGEKHGFELDGFLNYGKILRFGEIESLGRFFSLKRRQLDRISN